MFDEERLLTAAEAARLFRVHRDTTRRAAASGQVPGARREPRAGSIHAPWVAALEAWEEWYYGRERVGRPRKSGNADRTTVAARIGDAVRERRLKHGWTQADLAHRAGLSPWVVGVIERGQRLLSESELVALAVAFAVPVADLIRSVPDPWRYWPGLYPPET